MEDDYLRDQNRQLRSQIEFLRDFVIYLCEEELNDTVTECEERFKKFQEKPDDLGTN